MGRRSTRKSSAAKLLASPSPPLPAPHSDDAAGRSPTLSPAESPVTKFELNLDAFNTDLAQKKRSTKRNQAVASGFARMQPTGSTPSPAAASLKGVNTISDLKVFVSDRLEGIKRQLENSQSEIFKDIEASHCRLQKRFKIQTQACQRVSDEAEREYKKISERINDGCEAMKASYAEFIAEAQASVSRLCKTSIPELAQSFEKSVDSLRSRYGITSTSA